MKSQAAINCNQNPAFSSLLPFICYPHSFFEFFLLPELSMAIRFFSPYAFFPINGNKSLANKRTSAICNCNLKIEVSSSSHAERISLAKEVFEDREIGVMCYRDEKGELVCEGYDEGPRFTVQPSDCIKLRRRARRYNLLRRRFNINEFNN